MPPEGFEPPTFPLRAGSSNQLSYDGLTCSYPRQESNLRLRFRRPPLSPLSYEGVFWYVRMYLNY